MSHCPVCGIVTMDPCGLGGAGTGPLPTWLKSLDEEQYAVQAYEDDRGSSYIVEHKHVMCDLCGVLGRIARNNPERAKKITCYVDVMLAIERTVREHGEIWQQLADM